MTFLHSTAWYLASLALFLLASAVDNVMIIYLRKKQISTARWLSDFNSNWGLPKSMLIKLLATICALLVFFSGDMLFFRGDLVAMVYAASVCLSIRRYWGILANPRPNIQPKN